MAESLLSFSNVNLFGNLVSELKVVDPSKPVKVTAATTAHIPSPNLTGNPTIDGVNLVDGDRVLVWQQKFKWQNGVYRVRGAGDPWRLKEQLVSIGGYVRAAGGATQKNMIWTLDSAGENSRAAVTFAIPDKDAVANPSTLQIRINGTPLFNAPLDSPANQTPGDFAAAVVDAINRDPQSYLATRSGRNVTITAPSLSDEYNAIGFPIDFDVVHFNAVPSGKFAEVQNSDESERSFVRLGTFNKSLIDRRTSSNKQLEDQLNKNAKFARIYGFTYEGAYYDLSRPVVFLVHGSGDLVTTDKLRDTNNPNLFRAPGDTVLTGLASAGFDFADGLRVWSYDKADYTIRMDVDVGMFEDVLLDAALGGGSDGMDARGMNVRGMNARGMNARGMNARGMNARGMNARGGGSD